MKDIINNIKLMKIYRDINFIKNKSVFYNINKPHLDKPHLNNIKNNIKYYNLLKIIRNQILHNSFKNNKYFKNITINNLKEIDIIFYENICKYDNIIVVDSPKFETCEVLNDTINIISNFVNDYSINNKQDSITIIKNNRTKLIYLYLITEDRLRCKNIDDKNYLSLTRKEKLIHIKEKEIF